MHPDSMYPIVGVVLPEAVAEQEMMAEVFPPLWVVNCDGGVAVSRGGTEVREKQLDVQQ